MKRILQSVSIMNRGGQETLWMNVFRSADRSEIVFDFVVDSTQKGEYDDEIKSLGGKVLWVGKNYRKGKFIKYIGRIEQVKRFFKDHPEYDTLHINTCHAFNAFLEVFGAKAGGVKRIIVHSHNTNAVHPVLHKAFIPFLNMLPFEALACSNEAAVWLFGMRRFKKGNVKVIKNGIDTTKFKVDNSIRNACRKNLNVSDNEILIGHVGRFDKQKNHTFLIDTFYELTKLDEKYKLILIGTGSLQDEIKEKAVKLGVENKVIFAGSSDKVNEMMMAMDLFLFPSLFEGLGIVLIEAQAAGLRCVCSDVIPEESFVTDLIYTMSLSDTPRAWADKVAEVCEYDRRDYSEAVKNKGFDIDFTINQLKGLY